jgi:hypothetical protein
MTATDSCPGCGHNDHDDDDRTDDQVTADVAATTLARLAHICEEHHHLTHQLFELAEWAIENDPDGRGDELAIFIGDVAASLRLNCGLFDALAEGVRDIAAKLPMRGIDFGVGS